MFNTVHFHPMIVHFPVAIILVGFLAELAYLITKKESLSYASFWLLVTGALSALAAYLTGQFFTGEMSGTAGDVKEYHELFALITLITVMANAFFRTYLKISGKENLNLRWLTAGAYAVSAVAVSITGYYGGTLVYNYMMPL